MSKEEQLLEYWRELPPNAQDQVLNFIAELKNQTESVDRGTQLIARMRGKATRKFTTDEIMNLTRSDT
ncbi:transcriptional regulator [Pseudanabaenaceae cyanobacterium LEGE 13415]|nr:transcriptional regulator [Pseudanabaenaceae cyanobacterium LEGE 13415]